MAIDTNILQIGDPRLHQKSINIPIPLTQEDLDIAVVLAGLLESHRLIGASAPQIGINKNIFVTKVREPQKSGEVLTLRKYFNQEITFQSKEIVEIYEGCGSVLRNGLFGPVLRPKLIEVTAYGESNQKFKLRTDGILARVILHEFDHLQGILFTERVSDYTRLMDLEHYKEFAKTNKNQIASYAMTAFELINL